MIRKTKIVATISNLSCEPEFIQRLHKTGMDVVRLNTAHMTHEDALEVINNTRQVSEKIAILIDTKGPEMLYGIRPANGAGQLISQVVSNGIRILRWEGLRGCVCYDWRFCQIIPGIFLVISLSHADGIYAGQV